MLVNHSIIYLIAKLLPGLVNFLGIMYYTRNISPENYGVYFIALSSIFFVDSIISQWFRVSIVRFLPETHDNNLNRVKMISTIFSILIILMLIGFFVIIVLFFLPIYTFLRNILILSVFLFILLTWYELLMELIRSDLNPKLYSLYTSIRALITLVISILLIIFGLDIYSLFIGNIIALLIIIIHSLPKFSGKFSGFTLDKKVISTFLTYGMPISIASGFHFIVNDSDRIMLAWMHNTYVAGEYSVAYDLVKQILTILIFSINLASIPIIFQKLKNEGIESAKKELSNTFIVLLMLSLPATLAIIILTPNISLVTLGYQYRATAIKVMPIIAVGIFFAGITNKYIILSFQITKQTSKQVIVAILIAILNIGLNLILIPKFEGLGAAYATSISLISGLFLTYSISSRYFKIPFPVRDIIKIIIATCVMGGVLFVISGNNGLIWLIIQIISGFIVYVTCIIFMYFSRIKSIVNLKIIKQRG